MLKESCKKKNKFLGTIIDENKKKFIYAIDNDNQKSIKIHQESNEFQFENKYFQ